MKVREKIAKAEAVYFTGTFESAYKVAEFLGEPQQVILDEKAEDSPYGVSADLTVKMLSPPFMQLKKFRIPRFSWAVRQGEEEIQILSNYEFNSKWEKEESE